MKNKFIILLILVLISIASIPALTLLMNKKDNIHHIETEQVPEMFAIMLEDPSEPGKYTESAENNWPDKSLYAFNEAKSYCVNTYGNKISVSFAQNINNQVKVSNLGESAYCYLYFGYYDMATHCKNYAESLSDCLLISERPSYDTLSAKNYIASKTPVDFKVIAPRTEFIEEDIGESTGPSQETHNFVIGDLKEFNKSRGYFILENYKSEELNDSHINKYTCGLNTECTTIYKILDFDVIKSGNKITQKITKAKKITYREINVFDDPQTGLYKGSDDEGDTYYYRGKVVNNYVKFAGFIWRIVRINGDGSIRMIYSGDSTNDTGINATIGTSTYNEKGYDPAYIGYSYGGNNMSASVSDTTAYSGLLENKYVYFAKSYTETEDGKYLLNQSDWKYERAGDPNIVANVISKGYKYTCNKTSITSTCDVLIEIEDIRKGNNISYPILTVAKLITKKSSIAYNSTLYTNTSSTIKTMIDTWYENNIKNKTDSSGQLLINYLFDGIFCNDRKISSSSIYDKNTNKYIDSNIGAGYKLSTYTYYNALSRINYQANRVPSPTFKCSQSADKFLVGNGKLKYPIALLTIDEAAYAGLRSKNVNNQFYLYTGSSYWTMTPALYSSEFAHAYVYHVSDNGTSSYNAVNDTVRGVRPVINLKKDVYYVDGRGTQDSPYEISLTNPY